MGAAAGAPSKQVGGERRLPQKSVGPCPARISQTTDGRGGAKKAGIGAHSGWRTEGERDAGFGTVRDSFG
ncbi:hypothetical protein HYQ44_019141 [Verticillium longisporum]|nr:hypothetical protein HYQ44_019141 [Verticillium longisporum]